MTRWKLGRNSWIDITKYAKHSQCENLNVKPKPNNLGFYEIILEATEATATFGNKRTDQPSKLLYSGSVDPAQKRP